MFNSAELFNSIFINDQDGMIYLIFLNIRCLEKVINEIVRMMLMFKA